MRASVHVRRSRRAWGGARLYPARGQVRVLEDARVAVSRPCRRAGVGRRVRLLRGLSSCGQADGEGCESGSLVCVVFGFGIITVQERAVYRNPRGMVPGCRT